MKLSRRSLPALASVAAFLSLAGCSSDDGSTVAPPGSSTNHVLDRASAAGLATFVELAELSAFNDILTGPADVTVFAPTEAAFSALVPGELDALRDPMNQADLDALIGRSIAMGELTVPQLEGLATVGTIGGESLQVDPFGGVLRLDGAGLSATDPDGDNGILHTVERVLEVPLGTTEELRDEGFGTFADLVEQSGMEAEFSGIESTVLAPTDAAFAALPAAELAALFDPANAAATRDRLRAHLFAGSAPISGLVDDGMRRNQGGALLFVGWDGTNPPTVNGVPVSSFNLPKAEGLIHGVDGVLQTPLTLTEALATPGLQALDTLLFASSLQSVIEQTDGITFFAPDDGAFLALPPGVFDSLVQPMNQGVLRTLLRSHVGAASLEVSSLMDGDLIATLEGTTIEVTDPGNGALRLDDTAEFVMTDVYLTNGILHMINAVLAADGL